MLSPSAHPEAQSPEAAPAATVFVGSSAGGLDALRRLIREIDRKAELCFVIAQHLAPDHDSLLVELLGNTTDLHVVFAENGYRPKPGEIAILPPKCDAVWRNGQIELRSSSRSGAHPSIDRLFESVAAERPEQPTFGVILSGTGTDGASGLDRMERVGIPILVQDPLTAGYDGMPRAALRETSDPWILPPEAIFEATTDLIAGRVPRVDREQESLSVLGEISQVLRAETGIDLGMHKELPLLRRIRRRMVALGYTSLVDYLACLKNRPSEHRELLEATFVTITEFFRDPDSFREIDPLIGEAIGRLKPGVPLRAWCAGCSAGQEAYSLSFLVHHRFRSVGLEPRFEVFATDILDKKIAEGRRATYRKSQVKNVPKELRSIYLSERNDLVTVSRGIRDRMVFSTHDLARDVPFSNIDIASCRNVLIYLNDSARERAIHSLTYALRPGGILFLGPSESLGEHERYFEVVSRKERIYRRKRTAEPLRLAVSDRATPLLLTERNQSSESRARSIESQLNHHVIHESSVCFLLLDEEDHLVYTVGNPEDYLEIADGRFTRDLFGLIEEELRAPLRRLCNQVRANGADSASVGQTIRREGSALRLMAAPFDPYRPDWVLTSVRPDLVPRGPSESLPGADDPAYDILEQELSATRESLHSVIEQLEATNEELQAANEELQASNEELNAANEELQSTNEELVTVNSEVEIRKHDFQALATDLQSIQTSVEMPLLVVDSDLRIRRWVNALSGLVDGSQIELRDRLSSVAWRTPLPKLEAWVRSVIEAGATRVEFVDIADHHYQLKIAPYQKSQAEGAGVVLCFTDLTDLHQTKEELAREKERALVTLGSIADGVVRIDRNGRIDYMNLVAEKLTGWPLDSARGRRLRDVLVLLPVDPTPPDPNTSDPIVENLAIHIERGQNLESKDPLVLKKRYGTQLMVEVKTSRLVHGDRELGAVIAVQDVSEKYEAMNLLRWQSRHDALTGVVNRAEIEERLHNALVRVRNGQNESAFLFVDLDKFKVVNDACGHLAGDELLRHLTDHIADQLRSRDTLARVGGDEFGILLENCPLPNAVQVADKVRQAVADYRFVWEGKIFRVGASIGVVSVHPEIISVAALMQDADAACYSAKSQGGNTVRVHTRDDHELSKQRQEISVVADINHCLEEEGFSLHFQPIVSSATGEVNSWEVLIRMFGPSNQFAKPSAFLPAAERFGLIRRIDEWVVRETFETLARHWQDDERLPKVSINLSADTVTANSTTEYLSALFEERSYLRDRIGFEITETAAISNIASANKLIDTIHDWGCRVALDDFGTGVSTYSYLKNLNIDTIKIDGEFISHINQEPVNLEIARSINEIAHMMGLETVAEYVHDEQTLSTVRELGIDYVQGYAIGRPYSLQEFISAVTNDDLPDPIVAA